MLTPHPLSSAYCQRVSASAYKHPQPNSKIPHLMLQYDDRNSFSDEDSSTSIFLIPIIIAFERLALRGPSPAGARVTRNTPMIPHQDPVMLHLFFHPPTMKRRCGRIGSHCEITSKQTSLATASSLCRKLGWMLPHFTKRAFLIFSVSSPWLKCLILVAAWGNSLVLVPIL